MCTQHLMWISEVRHPTHQTQLKNRCSEAVFIDMAEAPMVQVLGYKGTNAPIQSYPRLVQVKYSICESG